MIGDPIALTIRTEIERASPELVAVFADAQTSFVADAQQGSGCLHHGIKGTRPDLAFCGTAVTASGGPRDNLAAMAVLDVVRPGDVIVIATGADESGAVVGDHWAAIAKQRGAAAVVTDGLLRDVAGIEKLGPPTFARGASPNAGYKNGPGAVNATVSVGGVSIAPGDIVCGDRDGVVVVARTAAAAVAERLAAVRAAEAVMEQRVAAGEVAQLWDPERFAARGVHTE